MTTEVALATNASQHLAAELAGALHREYEDAFALPVRTSRLAKRLGLTIEPRDNLVEDAYLSDNRIVIRRHLSPNIGRFVLAHEIGHAVLRQRRPEVSAAWSVETEERFADCFAAELLFPHPKRAEMCAQFASTTSPAQVAAVASEFGVTPQCLLGFASRHRWFEASNRIWLRLKHVAHVKTGRDVQLRIYSTHCDTNSFYLPRNRCIATAIPTLTLAGLPIGRDLDFGVHDVALQLVRRSELPKYRDAIVRARVRCMRLRPAADKSSYYLTMIEIDWP
jgi:hypothetical protein